MAHIQTWQDYIVPENYQLFKDLPYGTDSANFLHLAIPRGKSSFPTLIWFHGGGMGGDNIDLDPAVFDGTIAVADVHYRLVPHHLPPAQYLDTAQAIAFIFQNIAQYGGDPGLIFVGGLSAGANMAALTVFNHKKYLAPYNIAITDIKALLLLSGQMTTHFHVKKLLNYPGSNMRPVIDELSPLYWVENAVIPIMLLAGEFDMPARMYENLFLQDTLRALGNENIETHIITGEYHGSNLVKADIMLDFIKKYLPQDEIPK